MYAIVKTGGKQYKVAPGDKLNIEKLEAEVGAKVELEAICVVDGDKVEADPAKAAATKVTAIVLEQFKGEKQLVFKFKKRKNYKKMRGHRQQLTRVEIESVGSAKAEKKAAAKKAAPKKAEKAEEPASVDAE
ncbi:50S ribosomal protein L21 [Gordonibacter sp. 28C]|uniref:50S ribosomal protein L21 n=1 Tax=Gordonibacter sp. 28C TaxID=2078569 RepID=UPI000DF7B86D|nr:50S ribosomal protein L21 [Gordonibacter sp. 28C]RDB60475.1 50S ribosomal protein L21 [Gordonibacter sp. 28C]